MPPDGTLSADERAGPRLCGRRSAATTARPLSLCLSPVRAVYKTADLSFFNEEVFYYGKNTRRTVACGRA